jgi:hypothetical protein
VWTLFESRIEKEAFFIAKTLPPSLSHLKKFTAKSSMKEYSEFYNLTFEGELNSKTVTHTLMLFYS